MKKSVFLLFTTATVVLAACMHPPPRSEDHMVSNQQIIPEESERLEALTNAGKSFSRVVIVPAANNKLSMLSNGVAIGVLMMDAGSAPADLLLGILRKEEEQAVAVVGKSDALTAATIEATIRQLDNKPTTTTILFAGKSKYVEQLQKVTDKAGVPFEGVVFPAPEEKDSPQEATE
ncbi:MAG: hypothetical protein LBE22_01350 [Azoarcus sp.]|jgi:hypothetical protein|nr:hypothetical protein [Azoarcus sp.]